MSRSTGSGPAITVCIPTHDRARELEQLLISVRRHAPDFAIVISDNASGDETPAVVRRFCRDGEPLVYRRQESDIGAPANLLQAVKGAGTDWVMLMSDDDVIRAPLGRLQRIAASGHADIVLLGRCDGDRNLSILRTWPYIRKSKSALPGGEYVFTQPESLLASGLCLGAAFSLISGLAVRKSAWLRSLADLMRNPAAQPFSASLFPQAWILLNAMRLGAWVHVVDRPLVLARHGNDRLCQNHVLKRAALDIREFGAIGDFIGQSCPGVAAAMQGLIRRHIERHVFPFPLAALYQRGKFGDPDWRDFCQLAGKYMSLWQKLAPALVPVRLLEFAYRRHRGWRDFTSGAPRQLSGMPP